MPGFMEENGRRLSGKRNSDSAFDISPFIFQEYWLVTGYGMRILIPKV
jgi:hypothetical protein